MNDLDKHIDIIHNCETRFYNWLKFRLGEKGILMSDRCDLSELLVNYENELNTYRQQIKPLQKWDKIKCECYELGSSLNGHADDDIAFAKLVEKTAFDGQVLWLTFQEE